MATRKKSTDTEKPPTKRTRKKANPNPAEETSPQQDLIGIAAQVELPTPEPSMQAQVPAEEDGSVPAPEPPESNGPALQESLPPPQSDTPATPSRLPVNAAAQTWLLATNHHNLLTMLAAGMVMGPAGFSGKHYRDPSSELPGLIPVFCNSVPKTAIQQATSEKNYLRACIVELDLARIAGTVRHVSVEGSVQTGTWPDCVDSETRALLVRAPLPLTLVKRVLFRTSDDRAAFESTARNYANIDVSDLRIEVSDQIFDSPHSTPWSLPESSEPSVQAVVDRAPAHGNAIGGALAMMYQIANRNAFFGSAFRIASGAGNADDCDVVQRDSVLTELRPWFEFGGVPQDGSVQARLFWGVARALMDAKAAGTTERPADTVLGFLEGQLPSLKDTTHQPRLERLMADMRATFGLGGGTISELFDRHKGSLSRPLLLFCLREKCVDLLEFSHPDLSDEEFLLAAILFGVRDGWMGMPFSLRAPKELTRFVQHWMFEIESRQQNERLSLNSAPPRPVPLSELFVGSEAIWNEARHTAMVTLAKRLGWHDCIVSRIRLPQGQYRLHISSDGIEVIVRGDIKPPTAEVDKAGFLKKIAQWPPLTRDIESEIRAALESRAPA